MKPPGLLFLMLAMFWSPLLALNQMSGHPSPYLALHAQDPVQWRIWDESVFTEARRDNRLVYVSIGYFSCHWCHVMQQESYRDAAVAEVLNRDFIAVKVDRELDPDLDRRLMNFVEKVRGAAGWPLNVFLTPEGYPVTGFTYLSRERFIDVLQKLGQEWRDNHQKYAQAAQAYFKSELQDLDNQAFDAPQIPAQQLTQAFVSQVMLVADELQGGFGETSKFPNVPQLDTLLEIIAREVELDSDVAAFVQLSLQSMATRNLQDHVNDGFFRYTTDPDWQTPHYEKMLYDNAQLASLYLKAHRLWPDKGYAELAMRTLDFVETELKHADGGYMSSLSAVDRNDREGGAYLWTRDQLSTYIDAGELARLENLWPDKLKAGEFLLGPLINRESGDSAEIDQRIRNKLRQRRIDVPVDDKRLAAWNAMMLDALTLASEYGPVYATRAKQLYVNMEQEFLHRDGSLNRLAGDAAVAEAVLEDYAQVSLAFLNYGRVFGDSKAVETAARLAERAHERFVEDGRWRQKTNTLIPLAPAKWIIPDLVLFSPMSVWLETALNADGIDPAIRESARSMLRRASRDMLNSPYFYGSYIMLRINYAG
jgi:uncharacterized protein YyaL (SSP411 family)